MRKRRVVITGLGIVCPVGNNVSDAWKNIINGVSGIAPIDTAMQILSCRPAAGNLGWYGRWQNMILNFYRNAETLQQVEQRQVCYDEENKPISCPITAPARDIKENLYLSALGLCVPGIIENMEELRQIKCRTLYCYEEEVPANIANYCHSI